jgi:hypothetical protein
MIGTPPVTASRGPTPKNRLFQLAKLEEEEEPDSEPVLVWRPEGLE